MCTVVELEDCVHGVVGPHRAVHVTPRADGRPEVLHLFSGPKGRSDGLAAHLEALGISVLEIDSGGETDHPDNLLQGDLFQQLLTSTGSGRFIAVVIGTPCSTFSVARFRPGGAPVVRKSPDEVRGIADPPAGHEHEAGAANELVRMSAEIAEAAHSAGSLFLIENPIDRSIPAMSKELKLGLWPQHASLWQMSEIVTLQQGTGADVSHFAQCMLGGAAQKYTTIMHSAALTGVRALHGLRCTHSRQQHKHQRSRRAPDGSWATAALAAYPAEMNKIIAESIGDVCRRSDAHVDDTSPPKVGSKRPHAEDGSASEHAPRQRTAAPSSLRRNERESEAVLEAESLPSVNVPPRTSWFDPEPDVNVPSPLSTEELFPAGVLKKVREHRASVQEAYRRAKGGPGAGAWRSGSVPSRSCSPKTRRYCRQGRVGAGTTGRTGYGTRSPSRGGPTTQPRVSWTLARF